MHRYQVARVSREGQSFALRDGAEQFHVARATSVVPRLGLNLCGLPPSLGFHILVGEVNGQVFRMIFEQLDCGLATATEYCLSHVGRRH